ncbi:MAG: STAS domain-containing protein [Gemmataceae bacterium]|nr:STAS domain-containing protein [Gemmataceae bacterium]
MNASDDVFAIEVDGDTLIVTPTRDLRELEYAHIEAGARSLLALVGSGPRNLVMDFRSTDTYGSTALAFFVKLWKRVSARGGKMAFCNLSDHECEILAVTKLDHLWPIRASRADALATVRQ